MESNSTLVKIESPQIQTSLLSTGWNLPAQITEDDWKQAGSFSHHREVCPIDDQAIQDQLLEKMTCTES